MYLLVADGHKMMDDSHFLIEDNEQGSIELTTIVHDQNLWETEPAYDRFSVEILDLSFCNLG